LRGVNPASVFTTKVDDALLLARIEFDPMDDRSYLKDDRSWSIRRWRRIIVSLSTPPASRRCQVGSFRTRLGTQE